MTVVSPGGSDTRPPVVSHAASSPGPAVSQTLAVRPVVAVAFDPEATGIFDPNDQFVRWMWTAAVGAAALAELLRLMAAAERRWTVRRPVYLSVLIKEGLVKTGEGRILVPRLLPDLKGAQLRRLPPWLRSERLLYIGRRRP